ncbi:16S rRNA (guanine(1207)-N(2))-methyltransferase RsmC [[Haemophilus] felis]|nr:16S rRNA (guanine(1207)-N(2))-methyltransferase RsmC [[Haemophilus] felis]
MISLESQVLQRHSHFFQRNSVLFAGGIRDDFPNQTASEKTFIWSCYFDYCAQFSRQEQVQFAVENQQQADLMVFYWTKNKQEVQFQLMQLLSNAKQGQEMLIVGENRCGVRSVEKLLSPYGDVGKIDSARRCGLYHFTLQAPPKFDLNHFWTNYHLPQLKDLHVYALPGVFSASELDAGTLLLLSTLTQPIQGKVLDIGCGAGVIGSYIKKSYPQIELTMSDIHAMALTSAKRTLTENQLTGNVVASNVFSHIDDKFDLIISNPPFHDGIDTTYQVVNQLISQAKWHLKQGGELRIVANAFLPYADWLDQHFGTHQVLVQSTKFKVYSVRY